MVESKTPLLTEGRFYLGRGRSETRPYPPLKYAAAEHNNPNTKIPKQPTIRIRAVNRNTKLAAIHKIQTSAMPINT